MSSDNKKNPMLELFRSEVKTHGAKGTEALRSFTESGSDESLKSAAAACQSILGAAKLVNATGVISIAEKLRELILAVGGKGDSEKAKVAQHCAQVFDDILKISILPDDELLRWHESNEYHLEESASEAQDHDSAADEGHTDTASNTAPAPVTPAVNSNPATSFVVDSTMLELFKIEVETNTATLSQSLLDLEERPSDPNLLESLMRASHSIKGAARMVGIAPAVEVAHVMEDCFVAAQNGAITLETDHHDILLAGVDLLSTIALQDHDHLAMWADSNAQDIRDVVDDINAVLQGKPVAPRAKKAATDTLPPAPAGSVNTAAASSDNVIRISAERINRLMGMSGEFMVSSNWVGEYNSSMLALKKQHSELAGAIDKLRSIVEGLTQDDLVASVINEVRSRSETCRQALSQRLVELEDFDRRTEVLSNRLSHEVISTRMRPFSDGVTGFQRMVRDVAKSLGKKVKLEIIGLDTQVDRDILEKIEAPLNHLLRNSVDHGIESPQERVAAGKEETGTIILKAFHNAGMLSIVISDDGRGIDLDIIRNKIVEKNMASKAMAADMSESELLEFPFLPGFSTRENVTEISGRGVGLDVVHNAIQVMRGKIRSSTKRGQGLKINLQLPLTLSVIRSLLFYLGNELYAIPLARINHITKLDKDAIEILEDRQYFNYNGDNIGLIDAGQILGTEMIDSSGDTLNVVMIGDRSHNFGIVVRELVGERDLALQPLDARLGKVKDISAAAITDGGEPVLIIDTDDLVQSIEGLVTGRRVQKVKGQTDSSTASATKRVLVTDDSLTVREIERKLLESRGYDVDIAVDGVDGWNAIRSADYDLVISDIDMPRMNGIEFVSLIKQDPKLKSIPVMIVSYKDREEDRRKGLDAGADYYLTKGSFHDESLIEAVIDLIGEA